jgi:hypothetical protein
MPYLDLKKLYKMHFINPFTKPQPGLISITAGATRGKQWNWLLNPERVEYYTCFYIKFNPFRVVISSIYHCRGFYPRLLKFNPLGSTNHFKLKIKRTLIINLITIIY